ncbi:MAG TPA: hypothetical protein VKA89_08740 [Solirubrobacterales bacterium]|nr:hypothetical protein [Solirubrobacterales bacterium]
MSTRAVWQRSVSPDAQSKAEVLVRKLSADGVDASLDMDSSVLMLHLDLDRGEDPSAAAERALDSASDDWRRWLYAPDD